MNNHHPNLLKQPQFLEHFFAFASKSHSEMLRGLFWVTAKESLLVVLRLGVVNKDLYCAGDGTQARNTAK